MKNTYPVILTPDIKGFAVYIPDFDIATQGDDLTEAIEMARDAISIMGIVMEDDKKALPEPSAWSKLKTDSKDDIITLVDVDFDGYRKRNDMRSVKKNCTIPSWLNYEAEKAGVNFSQLLQSALMKELNVEKP